MYPSAAAERSAAHAATDSYGSRARQELDAAWPEVGHYMPPDGVMDETVAGSRAHRGALLDIPDFPGLPDKILARIEADL